jgi:hypothetical protein
MTFYTKRESWGELKQREPGTPPPALSKEEKKRNRPSFLILPKSDSNPLLDAYPTLALRSPIIIEGFGRKTMNIAIKTENLGRIYKIRGGKKTEALKL